MDDPSSRDSRSTTRAVCYLNPACVMSKDDMWDEQTIPDLYPNRQFRNRRVKSNPSHQIECDQYILKSDVDKILTLKDIQASIKTNNDTTTIWLMGYNQAMKCVRDCIAQPTNKEN